MSSPPRRVGAVKLDSMDSSSAVPGSPGHLATPRSRKDKQREKRRRDKIHAVAKQGVFYDPKTADPLSSRLVHRFMFAEFLGSLFFQLIAQGSVISSGALTYQFDYDELTPGRILCIAFATSFVSRAGSCHLCALPYLWALFSSSLSCFLGSPHTHTHLSIVIAPNTHF